MRFTILLLLLTNVLWGQSRVLHYDETEGFDHRTREDSYDFFKSIEGVANISVTQDSDGSEFTMAKLADYDVVIFSNTSGIGILNAAQQDALEWFIDVKGGGLIGIHAATDTYRHSSANGGKKGEWDWFAETLGGSVQNSPNHTSSSHVNTIIEIQNSPVTENLIFPWEKEEEYYYWANGYLNPDIVELMEVGDTGDRPEDDPRPVAWQRTNDAGSRIFYTSLGHKSENFRGPRFPQFRILMQDAVEWAAQAESSVLPSELTRFEGEVSDDNSSINLEWSTSSELNTDFFEIERSSDAINWQSIGNVKAAENSVEIVDYSFVDRSPLSKKNIYRLRQVDLNESYEFSKMISISLDSRTEVSVFPNPSLGNATLNFGRSIKVGKVVILDITGNQVGTMQVNKTSKLNIDLSEYPAGVYYLKVEMDTEERVIKVVKI